MASYGFSTTGVEIVEAFKGETEGKTIVITGASAGGLGSETAISLAHANPSVLLLLARSESKVQPVIDEIVKLNPAVKVAFVPVELDKASSIRVAAEGIKSQVNHIDILINNAGIMASPYRKNEVGIESQFATNHIGHFLLTNLLLDNIKAAGNGARIVNLSSSGYKLGPVRFEDWNFSDGKEYDEWSGYGQAKTANILFTRYLSKHLQSHGVSSFAVHPGAIMETQLAAELDFALFEKLSEVSMKNTGLPFTMDSFKSRQQGVSTTLRVSLDPSLKSHSGEFFADCNSEELREYAASEQNAAKLWALSEQLVGQKFKL